MAGQQEHSTKAKPPNSSAFCSISLFPFSLILGTSFGAVLDMVTDRYLCYFLSLKPRPKTNPSADHFQYCVHYPGSDIHARRGLET